jgi:hypothetical protein
MLIDSDMEAQISLDRLARMAPDVAAIHIAPAPPKKDDSERVKIALNETQFRRLCYWARREFESLATIGGYLIEMEIERYGR